MLAKRKKNVKHGQKYEEQNESFTEPVSNFDDRQNRVGIENNINADDDCSIYDAALRNNTLRMRRRSHASSLKDNNLFQNGGSSVTNIIHIFGSCRDDKVIIISPESNFRLAWDAFVGLLVVYYTIIVPVRVAFDRARTKKRGNSSRYDF